MNRFLSLAALSALVVCSQTAGAASRAPALTSEDVDTQGYKYLFSDQEPPPRSGGVFEDWSLLLRTDELESFERRLTFRLVLERPETPYPETLPLLVLDASLGDWCDSKDLDVRETEPPPGFQHLGVPKGCAVVLPENARSYGGTVAGEVTIHRPRVERVEDRFAFSLPIQPLVHRADRVELAVEYPADEAPRIRSHRWDVELGRQVLPRDRERQDVALLGVNPLPLGEGVGTIIGRVPTLLLDSGEGWGDVATTHSVFYDNAARAEGAVIPLAGAVYAQPDVPSAAQEAVIRALDGIELDPSGGTGGAWRLPVSAVSTVEDGRGTAADRAALLVSLLRTADVRAEVLLVSSASVEVEPDEPLPVLDTTLVVVPKGAPDGSDLYVDPSKGSLWLGSLSEELLGRDALLVSRAGARWVRTPDVPPRRNWTLNATEREDGDFDVTVRGELSGAPAARMRQWLVQGRPEESRPDSELAWLGGAWAEAMEPRFHSPDGVRVVVRAKGVLPRDTALPEGHLAAPELPVAAAAPAFERWPYARDARPLRLEVLESWTFRGNLSGPPAPPGDKVTPFWTVSSEGDWSGPVFTRRTQVDFTARELPRNAAVEADRYQSFLARLLGEVEAPPPPP